MIRKVRFKQLPLFCIALSGILSTLALGAAATLFIVQPGQGVVISGSGGQLGEIKRVALAGRVHVRLPAPLENVNRFDLRVQVLTLPATSYVTADNRQIRAEFGLTWRIASLTQYFLHHRGDSDLSHVQNQLIRMTQAALRAHWATRTFVALRTDDQGAMLKALTAQMHDEMKAIGVELIDLRMVRMDLVTPDADAAYRDMTRTMQEKVNRLRITTAAEAAHIRHQAGPKREAILSQAYQAAQKTKGEGDARAAAIEADAMRRSPDFYRFYKRLRAAQRIFNEHDVIVVDTNSEFFRFMHGTVPGAVSRKP